MVGGTSGGGGLVVLGYRRPIGNGGGFEDRAPHVADVNSYVLGDGVVSVNLDSFPDATWVPVLDAGDELGLVPVDGVVFGVGVLDDRGLVDVSFPAMGSVFIESGREVPASLADVHFAALARDLVDTWSAVGVLAVLV